MLGSCELSVCSVTLWVRPWSQVNHNWQLLVVSLDRDRMTGSSGPHDDGAVLPLDPFEQGREPDDAGSSEAPTRPLVGMGDRCVTCDAPLAPDQRYCLNCGERRGKSRLPVQSLTAAQPQPAGDTGGQRREPPKRRLSSGATLVAGVATLLLAMGVGVLIGNLGKSNNGGPVRASQPVQVVTVGGGGGGGAATTPTTAADTRPSGSSKASKSGKSGTKAVVVTKKVAAKANQAASKVLGASSANLAPTQVQQGQSCTHGAGCQGGKFTGNFFGP
jgi:hypothetical protein